MKGFAKKIFLLLGLTVMFILLLGSNNLKAEGSPVIEVRKVSYNESDSTLVVGVYLKGGSNLHKYNFQLQYNTAMVEIINYGDSEVISLNGNCDIPAKEDELSYDGGLITLNSIDLIDDIEIASDQTICRIKFKLLGTEQILEENRILNNLFEISNMEVNDEGYDDSLAEIKPMAKEFNSVTLQDAIFDKDEYKHGETINLIGGIAIINYSNTNNKIRVVDLSTNREMKKDASGNYMKDEDGNYIKDENGIYINIEKGPFTADYNNPNVKITYEGKNSNTVSVNVIDWIENIRFEAPTIRHYKYNDELNISDAKVYIKKASKVAEEVKTLQEEIDSGKATISGFDSTAEEIKNSVVTQIVTVNLNYPDYEGVKEFAFEVTINDKIKNITFKAPDKKEYEYQESKLDLAGGKIIIEMISGEIIERNLRNITLVNSTNILRSLRETLNLNDEMEVTGFDSTKYGAQTITVKYYYEEDGIKKNKTFTYEINIKAGIRSTELIDDNMTIDYGHEITDDDLTNIKIVITKTDLTTEEINVTADMVEYNKYGSVDTAQTGYVKYNGQKLPLYINLRNYVDSIKLSKDDITILYGENLDETKLTSEYKIIEIMANGDEGATVQLTEDKIEGTYNSNKEGSYNVKVNHDGKLADFEIKVVDSIIDIRLDNEERDKIQKEYLYNEELILNEAQLTVIKLSGETKVDLTKEMIVNYNPQQLGEQKLDIQYGGKELKEAFEVEVKDYIVDIILVKPNKTIYAPDEKLDLTGATVRTISASGKLGETEAVTFDMISGYVEGEMGTQRITVKYEGFEKTFDAIFTAQTGMSNINVYKVLSGIIMVVLSTSVAIVTMKKVKENDY